MKINMLGMCVAVVVEAAASAGEVQGRAKVRFKPYFKSRARGTGELVQFYKAIYPPDYSDLSTYSPDELRKMAASAEGPEDTPFFVEQDDDIYFGRSRECRETKLTDRDLAWRCVRADVLGMRHATIYTLWNLYVCLRPFLVFFVVASVVVAGCRILVQLTQSLVRFVTSLPVSDEALIEMLKNCITDIYPGSYAVGGSSLRWKPEQIEILRRLRLKMYYNYMRQKDGGHLIEDLQLE